MKRYQNRYIFSSDIMRRQKRARRRVVSFLGILLFLVFALFMGNLMTSRHLVVEDLRVTVLDLPKDLEEYSILHISDLHGARFGDKQKAAASALGTRRYSAVVITGDVLGPERDISPLLELIALMPEETPKYYIPGDVDGDPIDYSAHGSLSVYTEWAEQMIRAGVTILDRPVSETRKKGTIWFIPEELYAIDLDGLEATYRTQMDILNQRAASLTADDAARIRATGYQLARIAEIRELKSQVKPEDVQIVLTHTPLSDEYVSGTAAWSEKGAAFSIRYASMVLAVDDAFIFPVAQVIHRGTPADIVAHAVYIAAEKIMGAVDVDPVPEHMRLTVRHVFPVGQIRIDHLFAVRHRSEPPVLIFRKPKVSWGRFIHPG